MNTVKEDISYMDFLASQSTFKFFHDFAQHILHNLYMITDGFSQKLTSEHIQTRDYSSNKSSNHLNGGRYVYITNYKSAKTIYKLLLEN